MISREETKKRMIYDWAETSTDIKIMGLAVDKLYDSIGSCENCNRWTEATERCNLFHTETYRTWYCKGFEK